MGKSERLGRNWKELIDVDMPKSSPTTKLTVASCIWNGYFPNRPIPQDLAKKITPNLTREEITDIINQYLGR